MGTANLRTKLLGLLGLLLAGCVTNPQPFPLPIAPDAKAIFVSNPELAERAVATGVPGAVAAPELDSEIVLSTSPGGEQVRGPIFEDGSFSLWLRLKQGDRLEARVERAGQSSARVEVPFRVETPNDAILVVRTVSAVKDGTTTVSGGYRAGQRVLIGNLRSGAATLALTDAANDFSATLAAAPGDKLSVFGLDPTTLSTSVAVEAAVPGP
jgi:hypothetical protein